MIRVAVVHHSALARESLSSALETAGGVAAEWASTAPEMTAAALGGSVDVVLAAAELPGLAEVRAPSPGRHRPVRRPG
ncbi:hypothetical protein ACMATS_26115 [Streptoverticillium reticulum]|uniref:hypothetical protein n=1 Tax=Streptoverticillium reticulum TaxID=1433415 RepID=UPI0039BF5EF0